MGGGCSASGLRRSCQLLAGGRSAGAVLGSEWIAALISLIACDVALRRTGDVDGHRQLGRRSYFVPQRHAVAAAVEAAHKSDKAVYSAWRNQGQKKSVLKVADEKELYKFAQLAKDEGLVTAIITDAGRTCIEPGTVTCVGIGPAQEEDIDRITGNLGLL